MQCSLEERKAFGRKVVGLASAAMRQLRVT
jgi:hypothetical protein